MVVDHAKILNIIFDWIPNSSGFETKIKPILISKDSNGHFNEDALLNRFAYTIVDQQRDVESIIIPLWNALLYYGMNYDFLLNSENASQFISTIFQAYGHQQYHIEEELKIQNKKMGSRTEALMNCYIKRNPVEFFRLIKDNQKDLFRLYNILKEYLFISDKSASFFLRDIEGFDFSLVPIDSNVARSVQRTGLYFHDFKKEDINIEEVFGRIIPIKERTIEDNFKALSGKIFEVCKIDNKSPYELNRYLFLLGADFCKFNRCKICKISKFCYYNNLNIEKKKKFLARLKS
ncbi:hypothetical protein LCGC14_1225250 [marine sediment metagenome]|uniref:Uncharacterized protein n=1 Tax=marine sediment metagenome TaxID=412755 RepID=A0A0F9LE70_9ZZZZ